MVLSPEGWCGCHSRTIWVETKSGEASGLYIQSFSCPRLSLDAIDLSDCQLLGLGSGAMAKCMLKFLKDNSENTS